MSAEEIRLHLNLLVKSLKQSKDSYSRQYFTHEVSGCLPFVKALVDFGKKNKSNVLG